MWWIIGIIVVWYIWYKIYASDEARIKSSLREYGMIWVNGVWFAIEEKDCSYILHSVKDGVVLTGDILKGKDLFIEKATDKIISLSRQ